MNKAVLTGRLTRDPEIRVSTKGTAVARFAIAVDRRNEDKSDFFNLTAFGKTAESVEKYLKKGTKILVIGHIQNDAYTNRDGQKITSTGLIVEEWEFCESKKTENADFVDIPKDFGEELPFNF